MKNNTDKEDNILVTPEDTNFGEFKISDYAFSHGTSNHWWRLYRFQLDRETRVLGMYCSTSEGGGYGAIAKLLEDTPTDENYVEEIIINFEIQDSGLNVYHEFDEPVTLYPATEYLFGQTARGGYTSDGFHIMADEVDSSFIVDSTRFTEWIPETDNSIRYSGSGDTAYEQILGETQNDHHGDMPMVGLRYEVDEEYSRPSMNTGGVSSLSPNSATLEAELTDTGGMTTLMFFEFDEDESEIIDDEGEAELITIDTTESSGTFTLEVDGLNEGTEYYYRAVGANDVGRSEGEVESFVAQEVEDIPEPDYIDYDDSITYNPGDEISIEWGSVEVEGLADDDIYYELYIQLDDRLPESVYSGNDTSYTDTITEQAADFGAEEMRYRVRATSDVDGTNPSNYVYGEYADMHSVTEPPDYINYDTSEKHPGETVYIEWGESPDSDSEYTVYQIPEDSLPDEIATTSDTSYEASVPAVAVGEYDYIVYGVSATDSPLGESEIIEGGEIPLEDEISAPDWIDYPENITLNEEFEVEWQDIDLMGDGVFVLDRKLAGNSYENIYTGEDNSYNDLITDSQANPDDEVQYRVMIEHDILLDSDYEEGDVSYLSPDIRIYTKVNGEIKEMEPSVLVDGEIKSIDTIYAKIDGSIVS